MRRALVLTMLAAAAAWGQMRTVAMPDSSSIVHFRVVFTTGSAQNPAAKPGVANLTAAMLARAGSKSMTYRQRTDALFPMGAGISAQVDQEMTAFMGSTHVDNLDAYYKLFREALLDPGWREDDFTRVKDEALNALTVELRGNNDEELGKEALYSAIYRGTAYEHPNLGTVAGLKAITLDDLKAYYKAHYAQSNLILGMAGGYKPAFFEQVKKDFGALPAKDESTPVEVKPAPIEHSRMLMVEKKTRSVAYSFGFPIDVKRGHPDYVALLVAQNYLGQHRSGGRLYERIRELRGINYGDYAYIEYFPRGMFLMEPQQNIARRSQIFQIWIRPAEPPAAAFTLRLAHFELAKLIKEGIPADAFARSKESLSKFVDVLTRTRQAQLGYAIDSLFYGTPNYPDYIKQGLAKLTLEDVNNAIRKHLRTDRIQYVAVTDDAKALAGQLTGKEPSTISYNSAKTKDVLEEDKAVGAWDLGLRPQDVTIVPVDEVFQQ